MHRPDLSEYKHFAATFNIRGKYQPRHVFQMRIKFAVLVKIVTEGCPTQSIIYVPLQVNKTSEKSFTYLSVQIFTILFREFYFFRI